MSKADPNAVSDARPSFDLTGAAALGNSLVPADKPLRVKVFKSGNSLAVRMPKALGLEAGIELELTTSAGGTLELRRIPAPRRTIDISGFAGKLPGFKPAPREDFEERPSTIAAREAARKATAGE
jgi:antitoxin VapB